MSQVIDSAALLPQHRERVYIVGRLLSSTADQSQNQNQEESLRNFNKAQDLPFTWPDFPKLVISLFRNVLISCVSSDFPSCFFLHIVFFSQVAHYNMAIGAHAEMQIFLVTSGKYCSHLIAQQCVKLIYQKIGGANFLLLKMGIFFPP
jgi:hypothetical protein